MRKLIIGAATVGFALFSPFLALSAMEELLRED